MPTDCGPFAEVAKSHERWRANPGISGFGILKAIFGAKFPSTLGIRGLAKGAA
jgi:hypothetical protein